MNNKKLSSDKTQIRATAALIMKSLCSQLNLVALEETLSERDSIKTPLMHSFSTLPLVPDVTYFG